MPHKLMDFICLILLMKLAVGYSSTASDYADSGINTIPKIIISNSSVCFDFKIEDYLRLKPKLSDHNSLELPKQILKVSKFTKLEIAGILEESYNEEIVFLSPSAV
jgi:hypothetical protein